MDTSAVEWGARGRKVQILSPRPVIGVANQQPSFNWVCFDLSFLIFSNPCQAPKFSNTYKETFSVLEIEFMVNNLFVLLPNVSCDS